MELVTAISAAAGPAMWPPGYREPVWSIPHGRGRGILRQASREPSPHRLQL